MKFLADMGISPKTVDFLNQHGHEAVHVKSLGMGTLPDSEILKKARNDKYILLTHDLDFGELVAAGKASLPSVIIFRLHNMNPVNVNSCLLPVIAKHADALEKGAVFSVTEGQIRVRLLPL